MKNYRFPIFMVSSVLVGLVVGVSIGYDFAVAEKPDVKLPDGKVLLDPKEIRCFPAYDLGGWSLVPYNRRMNISLLVHEGKALWQPADVIDCYSTSTAPGTLGNLVVTLPTEMWRWRKR